MKTTLLLSVLVVTAALAGCANGTDDDDHDDNMTTSPTTSATMTPATTATTPTSTTPATPAPTPGDGGAPPMAECEGDYETEPGTSRLMGMPELVYTAKDPDAADPCYAFVGPRNATAGWNSFTLDYPEGMEFHIMPMYFVGEHTMDDVLQAFASEEEPEWAVPAGGVGGVTPGESGTVAMELQEGNYMFFCPINGHMFQGMMGMLHVEEASGTPAPEPQAQVEVQLVDYNFTLPASIPASTTVIKVTNNGQEPHEAPLVRLQGNATAMEFLMAVESPNPTGPPPGALIGGVNVIAPGETVYLIVGLEAGSRYAMACFVESPKHGGAPHLELGMVKEFAAA